MPFEPLPGNTLSPSPDVQIFFFGLLLLFPEPDGSCSIGVLKADDHTLAIDCWEVRPGQADQPLLRLSGPLQAASLNVLPYRKEKVKKLVKPTVTQHFGLALNFKDIYPTSEVIREAFATIISLSDGELHTAIPTDPNRIKVELECSGRPKDLIRIASAIGANIKFKNKESLLVKWTLMDGTQQELSLPLEGHSGSTYEIHISNGPYLQVGKNPHDDFGEYYNVLKDAGPPCSLKFTLKPKVTTPIKILTSVDAPCMPGNHGG